MSSLAVGGALIGYVAVYLLLVGLIWRWRVNRRQERPPVEVKLLRGPAETLQKQLEKMDEALIVELVFASLAPLLIFATGRR